MTAKEREKYLQEHAKRVDAILVRAFRIKQQTAADLIRRQAERIQEILRKAWFNR